MENSNLTDTKPKKHPFLTSAGEMGMLIYSKDWSKTPLGNINTWPQSLRTSVQIMLNSRQSLWMGWGEELTFLYNDAYRSTLGIKHPGALGKPASEVWSEIWKDIGPMLKSVRETGQATWSENLLLLLERSGFPEETYHTFSYSPIYDEAGDISGIFTAVMETTEIVQGERQLRTLKDLGKNISAKKTDKDVFEKTTEILKHNTEDFPFTILYKIEEDNLKLMSSSHSFSSLVLPAVIKRGDNFQWPLFSVLESGKSRVADNDISLMRKLPANGIIKPSGRVLLLPFSPSPDKAPDAILIVGANPYRVLNEKYLDFFKLVCDQVSVGINNVRTLEAERKRADALAEIDKAKTVFFSNISHEFRTPLTLMLSPLEELMQNSEEISVPVKKNIEISHRNSLRLLKLVNTLLDFSRIEAGRMEPYFEPMDVPAYTADLASSFRSAIEKAGMELQIECQPMKEFAYIDRDMWEKIVLNLLSNAFKYTSQGKIELKLIGSDRHIELAVKDTGIGIPESEQEKIFERFHRIENVKGRSQEGTGIGLSLVRELVKLHKGNITVKSEPGKGSIFTVAIPITENNSDTENILSKPRLNQLITNGGNLYVEEAKHWFHLNGKDKSITEELSDAQTTRPFVLLADDNADMRQYVKKILDEDFDVVTVINGKKVLEVIYKKLPDLIVSDVMMPEMDGVELLKKIKSDSHTAKIPVILLSARAGEEAKIEGLGMGANDYLVKPFSRKELLAKVKAQISISQIRDKTESQLTDFFQQAPVAICIFRGPDHIVEMVNEKMLKIFGKARELVINKPVFEGMPDATGQGYEQILNNVYKTGQRFVTEEQPVSLIRNGQMENIFVKFVCEPYRGEDGIIGGIIAVADEITEQVENRKKVKDSEVKYKQLVESLPLAIYTCDKEGRINFYNDVAVKLWGFAPALNDDSVKYCACYKVWLMDGTFIAPDQTPMYEALRTGKSFHNVEALVARPNGEKFHAVVNVDPLFDQDGNISGAINIFQDISERKQSEIALQESEHRYRNLIYGLPAAVYTTDKDGYITMYNDAAVELWGREPEIGKEMWCGSWKIYELDGVTEVPLSECPMATALKEKRKIICKTPFIVERPDGNRRYFIPYPEPILNSKGDMTGGFNMLVDVTESKLAEIEKAKLAAIVESSADPIISKTPDGIITSWNDAAHRLFGYKEEEMIGQSIFKLIPDDKSEEESVILDRIKKGERIEHFETRRITRDGTLIDVSLTVSPIRDMNGYIIGASKIARDITRQKETEILFRENEERMRMAIESTHLGTWEYHPPTQKLVWSDECKKIYGAPLDFQPTNEFVDDHHFEEDKELIHLEVWKAMQPENNGDFRLQYRIVRENDKQLRWLNVKGKVFFSNDKKPERFIGTMLDITDEKNREQELMNSIELFQTMADNVPAMIWMSGDDKFNDYFNRTWLDFTGRTLNQESKEGWLNGVHPEDVQRCVDTYKESLKAQKGFYLEYRLRRYDGQYRWIADNSVPRFSPSGEFFGFISACIDIDDQKNFREKILESELLFKTISNASPTALWMTDHNKNNIFISDTWLNWTGKTFQEQIHRGWLSVVLEGDREKVISRFFECFEKRKNFSAEFRVPNASGELRWCLTEGKPYFDINDEFAGYAGSVTDITEIKKMEERKDDFIKMASHELKTPITSINGYVQLLLNIYNEHNDEKLQMSKSIVKSSLNTISKQVSKLTRLISELLDLSKIESGKLELNKTEFNLDELMEEAVQDARYTTSRHAIILRNDFDGKITADKDRLGQVLANLLNNAIKYSPDSDMIEVFVEGNKKTAVIHVRDYGIGIDKKDQLKIFERFYRVEGRSEQTYPGFGIGLFITSEIVQRHQGTITVKSEKNKGATFTVTLPITPKNNLLKNGKERKKDIGS